MCRCSGNRFGIDLWYEWNVPGGAGWPSKTLKEDNEIKKSKEEVMMSNSLWGEIWMNGDWRNTNFSTDDYNGYTFASSAKFGIRAWNPVTGDHFSVHVMPYITAETSRSEKNEFYWENRLLTGGGIRVMPIIKLSKTRDLLLRIYAEHVTVVDYFEESPNPNTSWNDTRAGVNFSVSRH